MSDKIVSLSSRLWIGLTWLSNRRKRVEVFDPGRRASTQSLSTALWIGSCLNQVLWLKALIFLLLTGTLPRTSMYSTDIINPPMHRSSRRIIQTTLFIASSRFYSGKFAFASSSRVGLTPHCFVVCTFKSTAPVKTPKEKLLPRCGQPRGIIHLNTFRILSIETLKNFRSFDIRAMPNATRNGGLTDISYGRK